MRAELDKYGIQMPAFGKIGGILATEMPVDEAALHAAVIAINEALDKNSQVCKLSVCLYVFILPEHVHTRRYVHLIVTASAELGCTYCGL